MTSTSTPTRRRAHTVPASAPARRLRRQVIAWSLAHGHPVDRDALAAIIQASGSASDVAPCGCHDRPGRWTRDRIGTLLWDGLVAWCRSTAVALPPPPTVRSTLLTYLRFLAAHQLLSPDSDRLALLRRAVDEHGRTAGDRSGTRRGRSRPPASVTPIA